MSAMPRGSNFQKPYPPEFRREAVELVRRSGRPLVELARELGISDQALRNWFKQAEIDGGRREGPTSEEREELRRLRQQNRILQQERDLLVKAAAFFARESETR
jgi:transposase